VKIHDSSKDGGNAYPLPPGWTDGEEVTVIGFDHGYVRAVGDGKEANVFILNIDSGWDEEYAPGKWRERVPSKNHIQQNGDHRHQANHP
jgi:hypothetical protein